MRNDTFGIQRSLGDISAEMKDLSDKVVAVIQSIQEHTEEDSPIRKTIAYTYLEKQVDEFIKKKKKSYGAHKNHYGN